jgi:hypothetical protein
MSAVLAFTESVLRMDTRAAALARHDYEEVYLSLRRRLEESHGSYLREARPVFRLRLHLHVAPANGGGRAGDCGARNHAGAARRVPQSHHLAACAGRSRSRFGASATSRQGVTTGI